MCPIFLWSSYHHKNKVQQQTKSFWLLYIVKIVICVVQNYLWPRGRSSPILNARAVIRIVEKIAYICMITTHWDISKQHILFIFIITFLIIAIPTMLHKNWNCYINTPLFFFSFFLPKLHLKKTFKRTIYICSRKICIDEKSSNYLLVFIGMTSWTTNLDITRSTPHYTQKLARHA